MNKYSTEELVEAVSRWGKGWANPVGRIKPHDTEKFIAIIAKLRAGDALCRAALDIIWGGVRGLVEDKDNDNCWLILMNKDAWFNIKKAISDYEGKP